jgi:hypothetical protein
MHQHTSAGGLDKPNMRDFQRIGPITLRSSENAEKLGQAFSDGRMVIGITLFGGVDRRP